MKKKTLKAEDNVRKHAPIIFALIRLGGGVVGISGSMAGNTFARTRAGAYMRARTTPVNPNSSAQQNVRADFGQVSTAWKGLTDAQRLGWNLAAPNFPQLNKFGESYNPSGFQLFSMLNLNLVSVGASTIDDAPAPAAVNAISLGTMTLGALAADLKPDGTVSGPAGASILIQATRVLSNGKSFVQSEYRSISIMPQMNFEAGSIDILAAYTSVFGTTPTNSPVQNIKFRASAVNPLTGQASPWADLTYIVTP